MQALLAVCLVAAVANVAACSNDDHDRQPSRARPSDVPLAGSYVERLGDVAALGRHLALPDAQLKEVQYTSPRSAAAVVSAWWKSQGRYNVAVLTTGDGWDHLTGALIPDTAWVRALPGGSVAVVPQPSVDGEDELPPFVLHPDGKFAELRISLTPQQPAADNVLVTDPRWTPTQTENAIWAIDVASGEMFPAIAQPCDCAEIHLSHPVRSGTTTFIAVYEWSDILDRGAPDRVRFMLTGDNGLQWRDASPDDLSAIHGYWQIPQGGAGWAELRGSGSSLLREIYRELPSDRLLTRGLWRGADGYWGRTMFDVPQRLRGVALVANGDLLLADERNHRLLIMEPGGKLQPLPGAPTGIYGLDAFGKVLTAYGHDLTLAVSTGDTWTTASLRDATIVSSPRHATDSSPTP